MNDHAGLGRLPQALGLVDAFPGRLGGAGPFGDDCSRGMGLAFHRLALSGVRSGTRGEPFPLDVTLRARCKAVLPTLAVGSPGRRLIGDVFKAAERNIREATQEEVEDE